MVSRMTVQSTATSPVIGGLWRHVHRANGHLCLLDDLAPQADGMIGPVEDHRAGGRPLGSGRGVI
jgi:hypothetical protein